MNEKFEHNFDNICTNLDKASQQDEIPEYTLENVGVDLLKTLIQKDSSIATHSKLFVFCLKLIRYYIEKPTMGNETEIDKDNLRDLRARQVTKTPTKIKKIIFLPYFRSLLKNQSFRRYS